MWPRIFWTYLVGPAAAILPRSWKLALPFVERVRWRPATLVSGLVELTAGAAGAAFWYMLTMTPMISSGAEAAVVGKLGEEVTEFQVGGAALAVFATHPVTWLFAYLFAEGAVRLFGAVITEDVLGILPLFLVERAIYLVSHRQEIRSDEDIRRNLASMVQGVRAHAIAARTEEVPDELHYSKEASGEILEIWASRAKEDWVAPKVVRVDDVYYRLEESSVAKRPRPFRYRLRRLEAGVPGRNVLLYSSRNASVKR